jgi:hypothetical protein
MLITHIFIISLCTNIGLEIRLLDLETMECTVLIIAAGSIVNGQRDASVADYYTIDAAFTGTFTDRYRLSNEVSESALYVTVFTIDA